MPTYSQMAKPAAWAMLVLTLLLTGVLVIGGCLVLVLREVMGFMVGGVRELPPLWQVIGAILAVVLPALFLAGFYLQVAGRRSTSALGRIGWLLSAGYHAALTGVLGFFAPGATVGTDGGSRISLVLLTGAAVIASLYLFFRYPRPPRLPVPEAEEPMRVAGGDRLRPFEPR